ncbi:MAG: hypothetical protein WD623_10420 [Marinobacter sp.]|uniref:hypothetical protein n=1 Tax=Marinobacter sp. TaxID=50741 RepID=UPI0034A08296
MKPTDSKSLQRSSPNPKQKSKSVIKSTSGKDALASEIQSGPTVKDSGFYRHSERAGIQSKNNNFDSRWDNFVKKRGRRSYHLPDYAKNMTLDELNRNMPLYFMMRWEFYVALALFVLTTAYFPWDWIADLGVVRVFFMGMEKVIPSISGLPLELRQMSLDASKAQLSVIHFFGVVAFIYKIANQHPAVWRTISKVRLRIGCIGCFLLCIYPIYALFFWAGYFDVGKSEIVHSTSLKLASFHIFWWLALTLFCSLAWSFVQELYRRSKRL